jgi:hypothetical protein
MIVDVQQNRKSMMKEKAVMNENNSRDDSGREGLLREVSIFIGHFGGAFK